MILFLDLKLFELVGVGLVAGGHRGVDFEVWGFGVEVGFLAEGGGGLF